MQVPILLNILLDQEHRLQILKNKLMKKIKNIRLQELQSELKKHQLVFNQKFINSKMSILILEKNKKINILANHHIIKQ